MDARIRNLIDELTDSELDALVETLFFAVDDDTLASVNKVLWKTLITSLPTISSRNNINHLAITPQSFYASVMNTTNFGIGKLATATEVDTKALGVKLMAAEHIDVLAAVIKRDFFTANGIPVTFTRSAEDLVAGGAVAWQAAWKGDLPTSSVPGIQVSPNLNPGEILDYGYCMVVITSNSHTYTGVVAIPYNSYDQLISLNSWFALYVPVGRAGMFVRTMGVSQTNVRVSITANFTIQ